MRAKGTWVFLFFVVATILIAATLNYAFRDLFVWLQINNYAILGDNFRLSTLLAVCVAIVLGIFFGFFHARSRRYVEQCVLEFNKVAWPTWKDTKNSTFVVVVVSIIASLILGVFDTVFAWWTDNNLFIW